MKPESKGKSSTGAEELENTTLFFTVYFLFKIDLVHCSKGDRIAKSESSSLIGLKGCFAMCFALLELDLTFFVKSEVRVRFGQM